MNEYIKQITKLPGNVKFFIFTEIIMGLGMGIWNLNLNFFLSSKGMPTDKIGSIVSVGTFSTALFALLCGYFCDRLGYRVSMILGCILKAAAMLGTVAVDSTGYLYFLRGINGLGDCFVMVCMYPYITSLVESKFRNTVYSLTFSTTMLSLFFGNVISGYLSSYLSTYKQSILVSAIIISIGALLRGFLPKVEKVTMPKGLRIYVPKQNFVRAYLLYELLGYWGYSLLYSMMNLICRDFLNLPDQDTGLVLGSMTLASGIALFIVPVLSNKFSRTRINTTILIALMLIYVVMIFVRGNAFLIFVILTAAMQCMMGGLIDGPILGRIMEHEKGGFSGLRLLLTNIGNSMGVFTAGKIMKSNNNLSALLICVCVLVLIQLLIFKFYIQINVMDEIKNEVNAHEIC